MKRVLRDEEPKSAVPSPEQVASRVAKQLPRALGNGLLTLLSLTAWITLPLNFISHLAQIGWLVDLVKRLLAELGQWRIVADELIEFLRPAVMYWRELTTPMREWVLNQLPWLPPIVFEIALILGMCVPPLLQFVAVHSRFRGLAKLFLSEAEIHIAPRRPFWSRLLWSPDFAPPEDDWEDVQAAAMAFVRARPWLLKRLREEIDSDSAVAPGTKEDLFAGIERVPRLRFVRASAQVLVYVSVLFAIVILVLSFVPI